jgi:hypothetical protein
MTAPNRSLIVLAVPYALTVRCWAQWRRLEAGRQAALVVA